MYKTCTENRNKSSCLLSFVRTFSFEITRPQIKLCYFCCWKIMKNNYEKTQKKLIKKKDCHEIVFNWVLTSFQQESLL